MKFLEEGTFYKEPPPLISEIEEAMRMIKNGKCTGLDGVPIELMKGAGELRVLLMYRICSDV